MHFIYVLFQAAYWQVWYDFHQSWFVNRLFDAVLTGVFAPLAGVIFGWLTGAVAFIFGGVAPERLLDWLGLNPPDEED